MVRFGPGVWGGVELCGAGVCGGGGGGAEALGGGGALNSGVHTFVFHVWWSGHLFSLQPHITHTITQHFLFSTSLYRLTVLTKVT